MTHLTVTAKTEWVWTDKAEQQEPKRHRAGEAVWPHYVKDAPREWLEGGLIVDRSEYEPEGQTDLFEFM